MSSRTVVNGISTPEEIAEHFRKVEEYIAGEDPETELLKKLHRRVKRKGPEALSAPQRLFYAYYQFAGAMFAGRISQFFATTPIAIVESVSEAFRAVNEEALCNEYVALWADYQAGEVEEDGSEEALYRPDPFTFRMKDLDATFLEFADTHSLFRQ